MAVKIQNKNQNDNPRAVLLDSLIMPYAHIILCTYVLIKKYVVHWHNIHGDVRRPYIYMTGYT